MEYNEKVYEFSEIPRLTPAQEKSPFASFYYSPVEKPVPEVMRCIGEQQLPVGSALNFSDIERVFRPEGDSLENGWCILPDGTGYSYVVTEMPEVTPAIEQWWNQWIMDPDYDYLNYRIWMPGLHISHGMPIVENMGWGVSQIQMLQPLFPPQLNLSAPPQILDDRFLGAIGTSGCSNILDRPEDKEYTILISCIKRFGQGVKVQTIGYMGVKWENGHLVKMHDADPGKLRLFITHNAYEFRRKALLAPKLYQMATALPNCGLNPNVKPPVKL